MARQFKIGRQDETLLNDEQYDLYKVVEHIIEEPENADVGPMSLNPDEQVPNGSLWIDRSKDKLSADLKYFQGGEWNLMFKNKFKITEQLLSKEEPKEAINGQLWIRDGILHYYEQGSFVPIKAVQASSSTINLQGFEDFIIINPLEIKGSKIVDNFSEFLFNNENPVTTWAENKAYELNDGAIWEGNIYICRTTHTSSSEISVSNKDYWEKLIFLNQFLLPSAPQDKFFINGEFIPQKLKDGQSGYTQETNVAISYPVEGLNGKVASAIHVNPSRLHSMTKKFIKIDKAYPVIEVPEKNTEYYGVSGGLGRLLLKTDDEKTTDYKSVTVNNTNCIELVKHVADIYDFVYAITYEFTTVDVKSIGGMNKGRFTVNSENSVYIGNVSSDFCVFAQGLYYEKSDATYMYQRDTGYLLIKEKLQDYARLVKNYDFAVVAFPRTEQGMVTNNFDDTLGFRVNLAQAPKSSNLIGFAAGINLNIGALEVIDDPAGNPKVKYIPSITPTMLTNSTPNALYWCIAETEERNLNDEVVHNMFRGRVLTKKDNSIGIHIPIYNDEANPISGALLLKDSEEPLVFVDGVYVFQKEMDRGNGYLTIYGLKEGQEVLLLADTKDSSTSDAENSDRLIFEDTVSYSTVPTPLADNTIVYIENGIICDASSIYTSRQPVDIGYHGEIRFHINYSVEQWYMFNARLGAKGEWVPISSSEKYINPITGMPEIDTVTGEEINLVDVFDQSSRGYTSTRRSISLLQNLGNKDCTYYAYIYADSIEKKLKMDYVFPNGKDGALPDISKPETERAKPFKINFKDSYSPGKNEMTIYLNGVRQNLYSPYDIKYPTSVNKEGSLNGYGNEFYFAEDTLTLGDPIEGMEGYYVYILNKDYRDSTVVLNREMTQAETDDYIAQGYEVELRSIPNKNVIFYVIEQCETGEQKACERKMLSFKDALATKGAFTNNSYSTGDFLLTRGNVRVYINGLRQPYGGYQTLESIEENSKQYLYSYRVIDAKTLQVQDPIIGSLGGNEGDDNNPMFLIGEINNPNGTKAKKYHDVIDEIVIETRRDFKLREITIPIRDDSCEFSEADGLPLDLFKSKDKIMIFINGLAYGKDYKIEGNSIKLLNQELKQQLGRSKKDVITFEWR